MIFFFELLEYFFGNFYFVLSTMIISCVSKCIIFYSILKETIRYNQTKFSWIFLLVLIGTGIFIDFSWISELITTLGLVTIDKKNIKFIINIAWGVSIIQYQVLALFIESISKRNYSISTLQKIFICISITLTLIFFFFAGFNRVYSIDNRPHWIALLLRDYITPIYTLIPPLVSYIVVIIRMKIKQFPQILRRQLTLFLKLLFIPLVSDFLQVFPFVSHSPHWVTNSYAMVSFSAIILTGAIYYYSYKIAALRFLNIDDHVAQRLNNPLLEDFRNTLEILGSITNFEELKHVTATFFNETFFIPIQKTQLYLRTEEQNKKNQNQLHSTSFLVETFLTTHKEIFETFIAKHRILMYQDIEFNNFYKKTAMSTVMAHFLDTINADIFIPLYQSHVCIGYIIIEKNARINTLYTNFEQDQMILYATYLGNFCKLLQESYKSNNNHIMIQYKNKINQQQIALMLYKEGVKTFYKKNEIGVLYYKNRTFIYKNKEARILLDIDPNKEPGHPVTKTLLSLVKQVTQFKTMCTKQISIKLGQKLSLIATPCITSKSIIITISHTHITDNIEPYIPFLRNPNEWHYLFYLQTTEIGKLIASSFPGTTQTIMQQNISILKKTMNSSFCLISGNQEDTNKVAYIVHTIHKRNRLYTLDITPQTDSNAIATQLFGINPIFKTEHISPPLMELLDKNGTLVIHNVHLLSKQVQLQLANYIAYNHYQPLNSERLYNSDVTIVCTINYPLSTVVDQHSLQKNLYEQLCKHYILLASIESLEKKELHTIIDDIINQEIQNLSLKTVLQLSSKEKDRIIQQMPHSITAYKKLVLQAIEKKKLNIISNKKEQNSTKQDIVQKAARLGKLVLKDKKLMQALIDTIGNKQKIATLLGVNRSSIYRHCKHPKDYSP